VWDGGAIASALVVTSGDCSGMRPTFEVRVPTAASFHSRNTNFNSGQNPTPNPLLTHKRKSYTKDRREDLPDGFSYDDRMHKFSAEQNHSAIIKWYYFLPLRLVCIDRLTNVRMGYNIFAAAHCAMTHKLLRFIFRLGQGVKLQWKLDMCMRTH
jgi:hypothetical protein